MANEIKSKYSTSAALTITLASLASSTASVGRQSTLIDNTTNRFQKVVIYAKIKLGTSPTADRNVTFYLIRTDNDGTEHRTDGAGTTDAALTVKNAQPIGSLYVGNSPATGDVLLGEFVVEDPGPEWGVAVVHDTGVNLDSTGSNHWVRYIGINPEVQ